MMMLLKTEWYNTGTKESNSVEVHKAPRRRRRHRRRRRRQHHHHHHRHRHHLITTCTRLSYESRTYISTRRSRSLPFRSIPVSIHKCVDGVK